MKASDELRYDHEVLRAKLQSLELFCPSSHQCACVLSRLTDSLTSCLRSHAEREERLLAARMSRDGEPPPECLQQLHAEHEHQRSRFAMLRELFQSERTSEDQLVTQASCVVRDLREHLAAEERQWFPLLDGGRAGKAATAADGEAVEILGHA